ncbi:MAG TPA: flagellar biosynthesis protein FlgB, partial [Citreicella sp.]|nr:flagellar biosynthesis protein FlgB [Citreicella sp.]
MFQSLDVFRTAIAMARHAGTQQALSAQNIANADTP